MVYCLLVKERQTQFTDDYGPRQVNVDVTSRIHTQGIFIVINVIKYDTAQLPTTVINYF